MNEAQALQEIDTTVEKLLKNLEVGTKDEVIENRFGGGSIKCSPVQVALYDWFLGATESDPKQVERLIEMYKGTPYETTMEKFHREISAVSMWFRVHYPEHYYTLID